MSYHDPTDHAAWMEEFVRRASGLLPPALLRSSGAVLYSSNRTLAPGRYYLMGLNPGGDPQGESVGQSLRSLLVYEGNAYLDEDWSTPRKTYGVGRAPLQRNVQLLGDAILSVGVRTVCAANLIFCRSRVGVGIDYPSDADSCWPVHEVMIERVNPQALVVFGNGPKSPYAYLRAKLAGHGPESSVLAGHADWTCRSFTTVLCGAERAVIGLPHLSRYKLGGRPRVARWIREQAGLQPPQG